MNYDHLTPGDRVSWRTLNGTASGIVEKVTDHGVVVRVDGGGQMLLSLTRKTKKK